VSNGRENVAPDLSGQGPVRLKHTVGLDIPCQVARLQSLAPLLQAIVILPGRGENHKERALVARCAIRIEDGSGQDRERDSGCIPRSDMAH
jgi:hypothetical protein